MEYEGDGRTNCKCCVCNDPQWLGERAERVGNRRTSRENPNYSIVKVDHNTKKKNLRRLVVIRISVKDHQLTLV